MKKLFISTICLLGVITPFVVSAQPDTRQSDIQKEVQSLDNVIRLGGIDENDPVNIDNIQVGLVDLLRIMFGVIGVLAVFPIVIGGVQFITSQSGVGDIDKAKQTLYWGVVGLIVAFSGLIVIQFVLEIFVQ